MTKDLSLKVFVSPQDIIDELLELRREDLITFVKEIDRRVADYDFTNELKNYFVEEMKKENSFYDSIWREK